MKKIIVLIIIFYSSFSWIQAQNDSLLLLDLEKALRVSLENNPNYLIAQKEIEKKKYVLKETKGNLLPNINFSATYNRNIKKPVIFLPEESAAAFGSNVLEVGSDNSYNAGFNFAMPLYSPQLYPGIEMSEKDLALSREKERSAKLNLELEVKKAFYNALLAQESLRVMRLSMKNAEENLENIKNMYEQGLVAEYDLIRASVQTENLRPQVLQAENGYEIALAMLKVQLGLPDDQKIKLEGNLKQEAGDLKLLPNNKDLINNNTDLQQMRMQMDMLQLQYTSTRNARLPSLNLIGNYQWQSQSNNFEFSNYNWVSTFAAGLQLSIPIFSGMKTYNKLEQNKINSTQLMLQYDYMKDNLCIQLTNGYQNMKVALEKIQSVKKNISMAEKGYEIAKTRYNSGQGTLLEVNDSELALTQARLNYIQAVYDFKIAKSEYEKIISQ